MEAKLDGTALTAKSTLAKFNYNSLPNLDLKRALEVVLALK
jgi:hypothetical protein